MAQSGIYVRVCQRHSKLHQERNMIDYRVSSGQVREDQVTASIEKHTSQIPSRLPRCSSLRDGYFGGLPSRKERALSTLLRRAVGRPLPVAGRLHQARETARVRCCQPHRTSRLIGWVSQVSPIRPGILRMREFRRAGSVTDRIRTGFPHDSFSSIPGSRHSFCQHGVSRRGYCAWCV